MPELPEVETIRRDLEGALSGDQAVTIEIFDRRLISLNEERRWKETLIGQPWLDFNRKGKYLWITLANGWRLEFHLRMTGQLLVSSPGQSAPAPFGIASSLACGEAKARLLIRFASGKTFRFCDQRRFGEAWLLAPGEGPHSKSPLGPDALTELDCRQFIEIVKGRTTRIQPLLMDQRLLAGVGNIYAQEALFKASIRPNRPGFRVTTREATLLYKVLQETLQSAINHRGSSSRNYRDTKGESGFAQTLHAVYGKGGKPCVHCNKPLTSSRVGGRGTVFCSKCQH